MKIYFEIRKSEKSGNLYGCIVADLGWCTRVLTFDRGVILDVLGYSSREYAELLQSKGQGYKEVLNTQKGG